MAFEEQAEKLHREKKGKIEVISRVKIETANDLSTAYTPGVAEPCRLIAKDKSLSYVYTRRSNMVAVVSDGSAVLGLGNIGAEAGMPVMEGKCILFKEFADVDAFPLVLATQDSDEIIETVKNISPSFGAINLEDISAPRCFEIENALKEQLDIPVFHDDQHGTAIVVLAGIINSLKLTGKKPEDVTVCLSGPGAAGTAIAELLLNFGVKDVVLNDKDGIIYKGKPGLDWKKKELAEKTNKYDVRGGLQEAVRGRDVFIGVSAPGVLTSEMIASMNSKAIVFAMANPTPEIMPEDAIKAGAYVVGSGRSDYPNQINNVLAFPGIFKGALSCRAKTISEGMKLAAAHALADMVTDEELSPLYVIPAALDKRVAERVAEAVRNQAIKEGLNRI